MHELRHIIMTDGRMQLLSHQLNIGGVSIRCNPLMVIDPIHKEALAKTVARRVQRSITRTLRITSTRWRKGSTTAARNAPRTMGVRCPVVSMTPATGRGRRGRPQELVAALELSRAGLYQRTSSREIFFPVEQKETTRGKK